MKRSEYLEQINRAYSSGLITGEAYDSALEHINEFCPEPSSINVILKNPGEPAKMIEIDNTLTCLQDLVDGYIEVISVDFNGQDCAIICNEEGLIKDYKYNCNIFGYQIFGSFVIAGVDADIFIDCPYDILSQF